MKIDYLKDLIQSCNINFLIGSGTSNPYLSTLGNIEILLTDLERKKENKNEYDLIKASLFKIYCENVIFRNLEQEIEKYSKVKSKKEETKKTKYEEYLEVLSGYKNILLSLNEILLYRHNNLLTKQVNIFTTNIDLFLEKALEKTGLEFNDGFKGRTTPIYDLSNFNKSYSKTSSHYDNISEIPVFNLLKVHGSINWKKQENQIIHSTNLGQIVKTQKALNKIATEPFLTISDNSTIEKLYESAKEEELSNNYSDFFNEYDKIPIVNPTKEKFERTIFEEEYYELLRIYANSLEKENTLLFVMGFSFADEHIKKITIRAAKSNPTLQIIIFAFKDEEVIKIEKELGLNDGIVGNHNLKIISPSNFIEANSENDEGKEKRMKDNLTVFNSKNINNEVFEVVKNMVRNSNKKKR